MASLSSYLTEVRRLLHDANGNFWSDAELTDHINSARERVCRDTGALRTLQISSTPLGGDGNAATVFNTSTAVTTGQYLFSNIFIYKVTAGGTTGTSAPPYPSATNAYPPTTPFASGSATLQYYGPAEIIPYAQLPQGLQTLDVLNVNVYWGNSRIPLRYLPWTNFNAQLRYWQNYVGRPVCFSVYGQSQLYIAPVPDQSYVVEVDTSILPTALTLANQNATDPIIDPYSTLVKWYAAYQAKFTEQSYGEADIFKGWYEKNLLNVINTVYTRRIPNPYSSPY